MFNLQQVAMLQTTNLRQATAQPTALQEADREGQPVAAQQCGAFDGDAR